MSKHVLKALPELLSKQVVSPEIAERISEYYFEKNGPPKNWLTHVFVILGVVLIFSGIAFIFAHNWKQYSITTKTILAFTPLVFSQISSIFILWKRFTDPSWKEVSAAFIFISCGATLFLIGHIYHIPGSVRSYLLTWLLLGMPLIYVMDAAFTSLIYLIGATAYGVFINFFDELAPSQHHWVLLGLVLPYYFIQIRKNAHSYATYLLHWAIPLSIAVSTITIMDTKPGLMFPLYFCLWGLYYGIGRRKFFKKMNTFNNGYLVLASAGTVTMLTLLSFEYFWRELYNYPYSFFEYIVARELHVGLGIYFLATILYFSKIDVLELQQTNFPNGIYWIFAIIFFVGLSAPVLATVLMNILAFSFGLRHISEGIINDHLIQVNYGLAIVSVLVFCRFFDLNISFIIRGLCFVTIGLVFFYANYRMLKRRKKYGF